MQTAELFTDAFEDVWAEFDRQIRGELLKKAHELGSLFRSQLSRDEFSKAMGPRFYEALENSLLRAELLDKFKSTLAVPIPETFDEVQQILASHEASPLHAFIVLIIYIYTHPLRAFFSGRDEPLPFNTISVSLQQSPSDRLPRKVGYGLTYTDLQHCPYSRVTSDGEKEEHPKNHWVWENDPKYDDFPTGVTIWVWHF